MTEEPAARAGTVRNAPSGRPRATKAAGHDAVVRQVRVRARFGSEIEWLPLEDEQESPGERARLLRRQDDVVAGDQVAIEQRGDDWVTVSRGPRRNEIRRIDGFSRVKTIAANVEQVFLVFAPQPEPAALLIERMLATVLALPARPVLILNKIDLGDHHAVRLNARVVEATIGLDINIIRTSTLDDTGIDAVRACARGHRNLLLGQSGVGKTSLLRALALPFAASPEAPGPSENADEHDPTLRVQILGATGEGQHTTTTARLYRVDGQTEWVDAPGVRDFTPDITSQRMLASGFPEIEQIGMDCRFRDCRHAGEPGCAVRAALERGTLSSTRFRAWNEARERMGTSRHR